MEQKQNNMVRVHGLKHNWNYKCIKRWMNDAAVKKYVSEVSKNFPFHKMKNNLINLMSTRLL